MLGACGGTSASKGTSNPTTSASTGATTTTPANKAASGDPFAALLDKGKTGTYKVDYSDGRDTFTDIRRGSERVLDDGSTRMYLRKDGRVVVCYAFSPEEPCEDYGKGATELVGLANGIQTVLGNMERNAPVLAFDEGRIRGYRGEGANGEYVRREIATRDALCAVFSEPFDGELCLDVATGAVLTFVAYKGPPETMIDPIDGTTMTGREVWVSFDAEAVTTPTDADFTITQPIIPV
jgi:hypothetical protein